MNCLVDEVTGKPHSRGIEKDSISLEFLEFWDKLCFRIRVLYPEHVLEHDFIRGLDLSEISNFSTIGFSGIPHLEGIGCH